MGIRSLLVAILPVALAAVALAQESAPAPTVPPPTPPQAAVPQEPPKAEPQPAPPDPREIVRRSVELDHRNAQLLARNYTYQSREVERELDKDGNVKKTQVSTYDHVFIYGRTFSRLVAKDDKPLNEKEARKEDERLEKIKQRYEHESDADREKRLADQQRNREENRKFLLEIPEAYDCELKGSETVNGRDTWIIGLTPRPGYEPKARFGQILRKTRGTLWIDKAEYQWVKGEAELIDTFTFGGFLLRLHKGARVQFEQTKVNDEVWLLHVLNVAGSARIALLKNARADQETTFSDYRRFKVDAKITGVAEAPQP